MKQQQKLLHAWHSRTRSGDMEKFSEQARQRIATLFLEEAVSARDQYIKGGDNAVLIDSTMELVELGIEEGLPVPVFCAELRNGQLSLLDILMSNVLELGQQQSAGEYQGDMQSWARLLASLDGLIKKSVEKFMEVGNTSSESTTSPANTGEQGKTLQHEIRTPLQGALLTTELMLEDAGHGDPVSADDILAVRKSIETAVGILNDFASRSSTE